MSKRIVYGAACFIIGSGLILATKILLKVKMRNLLPNEYSSFGIREPLIRIAIIVISILIISAMLFWCTDKKIALLTKIGKNTLPIYVCHRVFTLFYYNNDIIRGMRARYQIGGAIALTLLIIIVFGSEIFARLYNTFVNGCSSALIGKETKHNMAYKIVVVIGLIAFILAPIAQGLAKETNLLGKAENSDSEELNFDYNSKTVLSVTGDPIYRTMTNKDVDKFKNAFKIIFAGDLILLEDQVKSAYDSKNETYDFKQNFEYTKEYISDADYAIGVFEGPLGGVEIGYSTSNYGDGKKLALNFPDEWADAVKNAGFDLVTTANNHALDKGEKAFNRTINVLKKKNLDYTGTFLNKENKDRDSVKIVKQNGIKMAILSYVSSVNGIKPEKLANGGKYSDNFNKIFNSDSEYYEESLNNVKKDFAKAKDAEADIIIVLPHWGSQFKDYPNEYQIEWENNFKKFGADIILGDHTHSVQPVYIDNTNSKATYTLYSPGNYANIYRKHGGDYSALSEVYIDRDSKKIIGGSVIPMWTNSTLDGNYRPIPIYSILTNSKLRKQFTTYDLERVSKAQKHILKVMLGENIDINFIQEKYFFDEKGFFRNPAKQLKITENMKIGNAYKVLQKANNVCFVGDSITEGTRNGGLGWYEPLTNIVSGKIYKCGWGSNTVKDLLEKHMDTICKNNADLFVIAIGTNDIRYRNKDRCSMTAEEYIQNLEKLKNNILKKHPGAKFMFIAPWTSTDGDKNSKLSYKEKIKTNNEYSKALKEWTEKNSDTYINPNPYLENEFEHVSHSKYLLDAIHPNSTLGIELYSKAVLLYK